MKFTKTFTIILALLISIFSFSLAGCKSCGDPLLRDLEFEFETAFTKEEHIQKIQTRTEEIFAEDIASEKIEKIYVGIVYSFYTEDPEYFLVEITYKNLFYGYQEHHNISYKTRYKTYLGMIYYDQYIDTLATDDFVDGPSVYKARGYGNSKKYFGFSTCGVEENGRIMQIFTGGHWENRNDFMLGLTPWDDYYGQIKELTKEEQAEILVKSRKPSCGNWVLQFPELY